MIDFKNLSLEEHESLLQFPAYISLLAANTDGKFDQAEKDSAVAFEHIKTFSCDPLLTEFFEVVDRTFERTLGILDKELPSDSRSRDSAIKSKLLDLERILAKLGSDYQAAMRRSMESFKEHVSAAHHNILIDFIFPIPIKGLSY